MVYKRLFRDDESYEISSKHRRHWDTTAQQSPTLEIGPCNYSSQKPASDGEGENSFSKIHDEGRITTDTVNEYLNAAHKESQTVASGNISNFLWVSSNASDECDDSERALHFSFFPNSLEFDHRVRALVQSDDIYATLLDQPPIRLVSVGPEYQADVPEWTPQSLENSSDYLDQSDALIISAQASMGDDDNGAKLVGTCVIPMPDLESPAFNCCLGEGTASNCKCIDEGSVRCVRQHIIEARDRLRDHLGQKIFQELGFCDMGEEVAKKWSEEEEQAFEEIVLSNPASLGKNFWYHLSASFPSRTKKDLVSYYFNVSMLRKRAEQNRFDPLNIDSDNDEWQRSELGITEDDDDDDSAVESLVDQDAPPYNQENLEENFLEGIVNEDETDTRKADVNFVNGRCVNGEEDMGDIDDVSDALVHNFVGYSGPDPPFQLSSKIPDSNRGDQDIQDDSCTSYEYQSDRMNSCGPVGLGTDARVSSQE